MSTFKTAWIQGKSQKDPQKNIDYYSARIESAARQGAKLIVLPELFLWDYFPITEDKKHFNSAIDINSDVVKHFQSLAKELKIVLTLPIFEKSVGAIHESPIYHNSILLIESNGEIIGHYRKMHIPDDPGFYEKYYFTPGDLGFVVSKTSVGKIGLLICWDQWFPEAARINALKGADIILYPTAIAWDKKDSKEVHTQELDSWKMVMQSHAISNNIYVMAVNRVGEEGHLKFWGNSFLANPFGKIICEDGLEEKITVVGIDTSLKEESRRIWPFFRDRRIEKYDALLKVCDET